MVADPYRAYNFALQFEGISTGGFLEASGFGANIEVIPYREAGAGTTVRSLPGLVTHAPLTLRYGVSSDAALWAWFRNVSSGVPDRRNMSIVQFDNDGTTEAFRWNLFGAWPSAFVAGERTARVSDVAIETLTLVYDRMDRD